MAWVSTGAWALMIFILSSIPSESYPSHPGFLNNVVHFLLYFGLAALIVVGLTGGKLKPVLILVIAILLASLYGASDEFHQLFVPGRNSDPLDWMVDSLGAIAGALTATAILKVRAKKNLL